MLLYCVSVLHIYILCDVYVNTVMKWMYNMIIPIQLYMAMFKVGGVCFGCFVTCLGEKQHPRLHTPLKKRVFNIFSFSQRFWTDLDPYVPKPRSFYRFHEKFDPKSAHQTRGVRHISLKNTVFSPKKHLPLKLLTS